LKGPRRILKGPRRILKGPRRILKSPRRILSESEPSREISNVRGGPLRSAIQDFGRSSLFVYWIHVEMAYGIFSAPIHRRLPFEGAMVGWLLLTLFLFALVRLKNRLVDCPSQMGTGRSVVAASRSTWKGCRER